MPSSNKLIILTNVRKKARVSLAQAAQYFGLDGTKSRESVGKWESGEITPRSHRRTRFIDYLGNLLGLRDNRPRFQEVWDVLVETWHWEPVGEAEWQEHFGGKTDTFEIDPALLPPAPVQPVAAAALTAAQALLEQMPIAGAALPPPAPLPPGSRVPFSRNPLFVGRVADLAALATMLKRGTAAIGEGATTAATGLGGIGKTQLATEFVHRYGQFFAGGVFWLNFADANMVPAEVAACGGSGHLDLRPHFDILPLDQRVRLVRAAWESPLPRLLVFDNCEDEGLFDRWRPRCGGCHILITSRRSLWNVGLGVHVLPLGVLPREESVQLLRQHRPDLAVDDGSLDAIATTLGDLPLALHLAGTFLARYRHIVTPAAYSEQLHRSKILDHPSLWGGGFSPTGHQQHVAQALAVSYGQLDPSEPKDRLAVALLVRAAHFAPGEPIPHDLLLGTLQPFADEQASSLQSEDALFRLLELGLLETTGSQGGLLVRMHRLVVAFVRQTVVDAEAQGAVEQVLLATARSLGQADQPTDAFRPLHAHLRFVTDVAWKRQDERAADLCFELGRHLDQIDELRESQRYMKRALEIRQALFGANHPAIADALIELGWLLDGYRDHAQAQDFYERALAIRKHVSGENHPDIATSLNLIGMSCHAQNDYQRARQYYEQALTIRKAWWGDSHPTIASSLNNLGLLLHAQGQYAEALRYHEQALGMRQRLGVKDSELVFSLNNLGYLLRAMGRFAEARSYLEQALAIRERLFGPASTDTAVTLNHLARLAHTQGDFARARTLLHKVLHIREEASGPHHNDTANSLSNLGMLLFDEGDYVKARSHLERALAVHEQGATPNERHFARTLNHLGLLLHAQEDYQGAQQYLERALSIRRHILGEHHPDTANSMGNLAMVLMDRGELSAAEPYLEQALAAHGQALDAEHPYVARSLMRMGLLRKARQDHVEARSYLEQALTNYEQSLGGDHPYTAACLHYLGLLCHEMGNESEAITLIRRALAIREAVLGAVHPETQRSRHRLATFVPQL